MEVAFVTLHADLLDQADHLATVDLRRPRHANLRRAVSAAYYSLFHLFVDEATMMMFGGTGSRKDFRNVLARGFSHASMRDTCRSFAGGTLPTGIAATVGQINIPSDLQTAAEIFVQLQQYRHHADYNLAYRFSRFPVSEIVRDTKDAHAAWGRVRNQEVARFFLMCLPLWDQMKRA